MKWRCADQIFDLSKQGEIMGIVNVTPDSFSDGGQFNEPAMAVAHGLQLIAEGAAIIDIGGESTRPGAAEVDEEEEMSRVLPVIQGILNRAPDACISIDTSKAQVAKEAIASGARIINDVTGFRDPDMIQLAADKHVGVAVMHMQGSPRTMQSDPSYENVVAEIRTFFEERHATLTSAGVDPEAIVYDPGIGFGKSLEHNLKLLRHLDELEVSRRPLLLGVSRKSFIGKILGSEEIEDRGWPTVAITAQAREQGVMLHRVHEAKSNLEALRMAEAILDSDRSDT
ncbi:MAG: dihydropteroate synthase [Verrucomicrobiota bacterium]